MEKINCSSNSTDNCNNMNLPGNTELQLNNDTSNEVSTSVSVTTSTLTVTSSTIITSTSIIDTSPGTLRDVTMDNSYAVGGYRSPLPQFPTGASPPIASSHGGRTVREYEEQISTLRKENFNLKLRLYFVEETTTSYHPKAQQNQQQHHQQQSRDCVNSIGDNCSHGNIMKQLIDAKVEREVLRKELQEKQDILKEAAQAMTQMENVQKDTETHYNGLLEELQQKIHNLEMERNVNNPKTIDEYNAVNNTDDVKENSDRGDNNTDLYTVHKVHELEGLLKQSEIKLVELQSQNLKLEATIQERNEAIVQYEEKVKELSFKITELLENMQKKNDELAEAEHLTRCERLKNNNLKAENENLITVLKETQKNFHKEMSNAKKYEHQVREQQETLNRIQSEKLFWTIQQHKVALADKLCLIDELEEKLKSKDVMEQEARQTIDKLMKKLEQQQQKQQNKPIILQNISTPVSFETHDVVDNNPHSLSDSEALRAQLDSEIQNEKRKYEMIISKQNNTIKELKMEIKKKTGDLQNLVNKELWEKNREIERLTKIISEEMSIGEEVNIKGFKQQQKSFSDVEHTKALERNKLLQRRVDVLLQRLDNEKSNEASILQLRQQLQTAHDRIEKTENWCRDCVAICSGLTKRLEQLAGFLNMLLKHKDIIDNLAADHRHAIRKAVDCSLDLSKSLNTTLSISGVLGDSINDESCLPELCNLSILLNECEEANNSIHLYDHHDKPTPIIESLQAENNALKKELDKRRYAENKRERRSLPLALLEQNRESESEAWSEPDRNVSMARIGLETTNIKEIPSIYTNNNNQQHLETDSEQSEQRTTINLLQKMSRNLVETTTAHERCQQLEAIITQRNERILEIQCQLFDAELHIKDNKQHMEHFTKTIEQLKQHNIELEKNLNEVKNIENSDSLRFQKMEQTIEEKDKTIQELNKQILKINQEHQQDIEECKSKHELNIKNVKQELHVLWSQRLEVQKTEYNNSLKHDWIARKEYEQLQEQLKKLQNQYKEAQINIECMEENERELKQTLLESELHARELQNAIDETTLHSSKVIMERTKALQENLTMEKETKHLKQQLEKRVKECQQLQDRIQQLENTIKTTIMVPVVTTIKTSQNIADDECISSQSGYNTSEELLTQKHISNTMITTTTSTTNAEIISNRSVDGRLERVHNSSPDLGIESDAGRISSTELANNNIQLNRLKTIELKSNDNNFPVNHKKDFFNDMENYENIPPSSNVAEATAIVSIAAVTGATTAAITSPTNVTTSIKIHDCAKVEQENAELRHKLIRTKRALEMTYEKLRHDNQRKAQIEKEIRNQIHKTYSVLKNARHHLEKELK